MRLELDLDARLGAFRLDARLDHALPGVTALFGRSGAGKSTVLRAIAGFGPELGLVRLDGEAWQGDGRRRATPPWRRPVGLVFQDGRLFEHLDVLGNLRFALRRADPAGPAIGLEEAVAALDLEPLLARRATTLSGGERQRVAIARALLARPRLLLLDEPLTGLDRARKAEILPVIASAPARFGVRVIYVSHAVEEVATIAEDLVSLEDGKITGVGPTAERLQALDAAATGRFEAGSVLTGRVAGYDAAYDLTQITLGDALLSTPGRPPAPTGAEVRVRIRARDVSVALAPLDGVSIRNQLPARLREIRPEAGAYAELVLDIGGQELRARVTRAAVDALALAPDRDVVALVKATSFDRRLAPPG